MILDVRINPILLSSIKSFINVRGYLKNLKKDVYFMGYLGINSKKEYKEELLYLTYNANCLFIKNFINDFNTLEIKKYNEFYENIKFNKNLKEIYDFNDYIFNNSLFYNYQKILSLYAVEKNCTETMKKNYAIKLIKWISIYFPKIFKEKNTSKIIYAGKLGVQEYLFLYLIVLLGIDVLFLNPQKIAMEISEKLLSLSNIVIKKNILEENFNEFIKLENKKVENFKKEENNRKVSTFVIKDENNLKKKIQMEKEYEDLAKLAENVVMINIYDSNNNCIKSGSGVIFTNNGYILTNFHVVYGGVYYEIILENREERSYTSTIIKYSDFYDLAIIKIEPSDKYIPILKSQNENKLVRGQKVIAIGSPLGLFNSVSDGIISGFRVIKDVEMIQFTAPISSGSSGGALLNKCGQLIGLITAGFSEGQNINLAVSYKIIYEFIKNFL